MLECPPSGQWRALRRPVVVMRLEGARPPNPATPILAVFGHAGFACSVLFCRRQPISRHHRAATPPVLRAARPAGVSFPLKKDLCPRRWTSRPRSLRLFRRRARLARQSARRDREAGRRVADQGQRARLRLKLRREVHDPSRPSATRSRSSRKRSAPRLSAVSMRASSITRPQPGPCQPLLHAAILQFDPNHELEAVRRCAFPPP